MRTDTSLGLRVFHPDAPPDSSDGSGGHQTPGEPTVQAVLSVYLAHAKDALEVGTYNQRAYYLCEFAHDCGTIPLSQLKPIHFAVWMQQHPTWKAGLQLGGLPGADTQEPARHRTQAHRRRATQPDRRRVPESYPSCLSGLPSIPLVYAMDFVQARRDP